MIKVLELFSGTHSVGKCCDELGWESVSVDMILPADHECDIMDFDYKQYPKDYFDIVFASPPCIYYSTLQNCWLGRKKKDGILVTRELLEEQRKESDKLVEKSFEIIDYFNPHYWFLENPATGCLKDRDVVLGKPFYDVSYCMYSDWGYEKRTRIWTNKNDWDNKICDKSGECGNMIDSHHKLNVSKDVHTIGERKHKVSLDKVGSGSQHNTKKDLKYLGKGTNRIDRYRIPEDLIYSLFLD
tara:strand:- start:640 stop:1365 length:726 start_codon:yes stop_codon:yes gene_type:complete